MKLEESQLLFGRVRWREILTYPCTEPLLSNFEENPQILILKHKIMCHCVDLETEENKQQAKDSTLLNPT